MDLFILVKGTSGSFCLHLMRVIFLEVSFAMLADHVANTTMVTMSSRNITCQAQASKVIQTVKRPSGVALNVGTFGTLLDRSNEWSRANSCIISVVHLAGSFILRMVMSQTSSWIFKVWGTLNLPVTSSGSYHSVPWLFAVGQGLILRLDYYQ